MSTVVLQCVGLDVCSQRLDVCFKEQDQDGNRKIKGTRSFDNNASGFKSYLDWCNKRKKDCDLIHLMEATGVYHEDLCYYLHHRGEKVSVEMPGRVKYFIKSLNLKTKTDKMEAKAIAEMGLSCKVGLWEPPSKDFKALRDLSRTLCKLKKGHRAVCSQLHALKSAHNSYAQSMEALKQLKATYEKLIAQCEADLMDLVEQDHQLKEKIARITIIKGIGTLTVVKLLAETDAFRNCSSIRKLVSYCGLDVIERQSGKFKGKSRISKKGNAYIRSALYMPALSAIKHDKAIKAFYERLERRTPYKKQAIVAVMRKLLILVYTLWKNGQNYDPDFRWQQKNKGEKKTSPTG